MENMSYTETFTLTGFGDMGKTKYVYFVFTLIGYLLIIFVNIVLVLVIFLERSLHEPMYIFLCSLSVNALYGTAGFYPKLLADLLSETQVIPRAGCFIQMFVIYGYAAVEFTNLTVMAYDRYVAICKPLHYTNIMTDRVVCKLLFGAWLFPFCSMALGILFSSRLPLCGSHIERLYCSNWSVVKLSCVTTTLNNIVGFTITICAIFPPLFFILFSYVNILIVCQKSSKEFRRKALQTCLPHLTTLINYSITMLCEVVLSRLDSTALPQIVVITLSLEFLIIPPLLNPLMYGLNLPEVRKRVRNMRQRKQVRAPCNIPHTVKT
ncbi:olfactory receptor 6N1-like [Acipenser ruthenus]|uniref:olfactory receptor 6N1-like n=1 Tax=Acipenser ruthenus TaxID=7906 RepID=UPI0015600C67|nr:olfactory receptor 6N1-like [Acipenser ruthenus]XP_058885606.1 olfactory receptor 6N1-like [Acipenser ruthenus]